jgi:hypothetical protein
MAGAVVGTAALAASSSVSRMCFRMSLPRPQVLSALTPLILATDGSRLLRAACEAAFGALLVGEHAQPNGAHPLGLEFGCAENRREALAKHSLS